MPAPLHSLLPRLADPSRCPACSTGLPPAPGRCPACDLPLTGPLAVELLHTLRRADDLVEQLRALPYDVAPPAPVPSAPFAPAPYPAPSPTGGSLPRRTGLSAPSVPRILLGLGAACLLVAAVIFLAVAWSWLGVGGRTAVLVVATLATAGAGVRLARRELPAAAEALTAVALGLLTLDLLGARDAGWLGPVGQAGADRFATVLGTALALAGVALLAGVGGVGGSGRRLVVPQAAIVVGAVLAAAELVAVSPATTPTVVATVLACAALVRLAAGRRVPVATVGLAALGGAGWLLLVGVGISEAGVDERALSLRSLWATGDGAALACAVLLVLVPIAVAPGHRLLRRSCLAGFGTLATALLVLPALDDGGTAAALAWLGALLGWTMVVALVRGADVDGLRADLAAAVPAPLGLAAVAAAVLLAELVAGAAAAVLGVGGVFSTGAGVRVVATTTGTDPLLLVPLVLGLLAAAGVAVGRRRVGPHLPSVVLGSVVVLGLAGLATAALHGVPLAVVVAGLVGLGLLALAAGVGVVAGLDGVRDLALVAAGALAGAALVAAAPSAALTAAVLVVVLAGAAAVLLVSPGGGAVVVAGAVVPLAWAGLAWAVAAALDTSVAWCALAAIVGGGLLAVAVPRVELELAALAAGLLGAPAAIAAWADPSVALAVHLTVAGALVVTHSLVHPARRALAAPGGLLLAAATWVRLADLGVSAPEAYTLPTALVLVAVGLDRLRRDPAQPTGSALLPGLALALLPSLLWVLGDPVSLRALLLGVACLGLVLAGARLRWSGPVVAGAAVGAVLVARELAPYVAQTPQWVAIGAAGTLLMLVGVTWEQRVRDVRRAGGLLERLR
jgi:hypothetical protein